MKRVVVVSDVQAPYQEDRQVNSLAGYIRATKPDAVYCVGDVFDLPMVSRWTRGKRGEHDTQIQRHIDTGRRVLEKLQVNDMKVGNHDRRIEQYVENYAPALSPLAALKMENVFGLEELGVTLHRSFFEFAPGWVLAHGDEGPLSSKGGETALKLATRLGKNVVCSHTHRQGIITQATGMDGEPTGLLIGVEVGHMMRLSAATYLKGGYANWTSGFGVLDISNSKVQPYIIQMSKTGSFTFEGQAWEDGRVRVRNGLAA